MVKNISTDSKQLILTEDNDVLTITLNNPQYKNALSEELTPYLRIILKKLKKQNNRKILVIRGKGNSFCSGGNIKGMKSNENIFLEFRFKFHLIFSETILDWV